jgi:hypothetical protein
MVNSPQMTGCGQSVAYGPCDARTWHPDLDWLQREFEGRSPPKLIYLVNPSNPSGDDLPSLDSRPPLACWACWCCSCCVAPVSKKGVTGRATRHEQPRLSKVTWQSVCAQYRHPLAIGLL